LGAKRIDNSETVGLRKKNSKKNIWAHERKSKYGELKLMKNWIT
jgi:hypothetical protein